MLFKNEDSLFHSLNDVKDEVVTHPLIGQYTVSTWAYWPSMKFNLDFRSSTYEPYREILVYSSFLQVI